MSADDHHFRREDRVVLWRRIARHIADHPEDLAIALENLDRWQALGRVHTGPIHEWRKRILAAQESPEGMRALLDFMAEPNHDSEPIKSCSPFVGLSDGKQVTDWRHSEQILCNGESKAVACHRTP